MIRVLRKEGKEGKEAGSLKTKMKPCFSKWSKKALAPNEENSQNFISAKKIEFLKYFLFGKINIHFGIFK